MSFVNMRVFGAVLVLAGCAIADDWPQWRGPNRDGISTEQGLLATWPENGPAMLWQVDLPGDAYASPAVAGNTVFVTGSSGGKPDRTGFLCALDPKTGAVRWQTSYGPEWGSSYESARTTPTVVKDRIYIISGMGRVACMETKAGKLVWQVDLMERFKGRNIGWGIAESPLVYDNKIICHPGGPDAAVAALDAGSGATVWQSKGLSDKSAYCSRSSISTACFQPTTMPSKRSGNRLSSAKSSSAIVPNKALTHSLSISPSSTPPTAGISTPSPS